MGEGYIPPADELMDPAYARRSDRSDTWWRNILENPTTVQFDHRMLVRTFHWTDMVASSKTLTFLFLASQAYTTATAVFVLTGCCHSPLVRRYVSRRVSKLASAASGFVCLQAILGITTLLYVVPTPLAACHQAGSVFLLTAMVALATALRRPSVAAKQVRAALANAPISKT